MGDNRGDSWDSRYFNILSDNEESNADIGEAKCIDVNDIIGKAQFVIFPFNRFGYLY